MHKKWKLRFYSILFLMVFCSAFWLFKNLENRKTKSTAETEKIKEIVNSMGTRAELITFLKHGKVEFEDYYKDEHYVVNFNSFFVEYDKYGIKINEETR